MVTMAALAQVSGRPVRPWTALSMAAMAVLLVDPDRLYGMGFALSFGAVVGILGVTPRLMRLCPLDWPRSLVWVIEGLAVSIGAMAGTLPLTAWWFQTISPLGPVSNLFAGPLIGGVGVPAALMGVHGPAWLGPWALAVGNAVISVAVVVLGWLDVPPWTPAVGPVGAVLVLVALMRRRRSALAVGMMAMILRGGGSGATGDLVVTFLSVGQGDAVFIHLPDGRRWLVDGGPPGSGLLEWLRREGHTDLDTVFLTHPDLDHLGGLTAVVDQLSVGRFVTTRPPRHDEHAYRQVWRRLFERGIPIGDATVELGRMATVLHPRADWRSVAADPRLHRDNDDSLVLLLEHEGTRILLTGDIEEAAESWLASTLPSVDLIQAPHHGSRTSSSAGLVVATNPTWVVISCGLENRYGHPHPGTLAQWRGRRVVRTDRDGTLQVRVTDVGFGLWRWRHAQGYVAVHPWVWNPGPSREVVE